jgi:HSP20 family protein
MLLFGVCLAKRKRNSVSYPSGAPFPIDPNLDEALKRAVSEVLSGMAAHAQGSPMTYSINIRVDGSGIAPTLQPALERNAQRHLEPADVRAPLVEVIDRRESVTVIAEVPGAERRSLRVRATPTRLEVRSGVCGGTGECVNVINLPAETDPASASARYMNGILEVNVAKGSGKRAARSVKVE